MPMVKLRALDHRNNKIHTRWGDVTFDNDGLAELDVPADEVHMLRAIRPFSWLAEDHDPQVQAVDETVSGDWIADDHDDLPEIPEMVAEADDEDQLPARQEDSSWGDKSPAEAPAEDQE